MSPKLWLLRLAVLACLVLSACGGDDAAGSDGDTDSGGAGTVDDGDGDGPEPTTDRASSGDDVEGATETNATSVMCESDAECPLSFCGDPVEDGSRFCAPPGLLPPEGCDQADGCDAGV